MMTSLSKLKVNEEAGNVAKSKECNGTLDHRTDVNDLPLKEITERLYDHPDGARPWAAHFLSSCRR